MKKLYFICSILLFLFTNNVFTQSIDTNTFKSDSINQVFDIEKSLKKQEQNIIQKYNINIDKGIRSKLLEDRDMKSEPSPTSESLNITISKGEIINAYKYFSDERTWLVKYKNVWGFVPGDILITVRDEQKPQIKKYTPCDEPPKLMSKIRPNYPQEAKDEGIEGEVIVKILVNKKGIVTETKIIKGIPILNNAAIEAIKKAKFKPGKYKGKSVDVWVRIPIGFELQKY